MKQQPKASLALTALIVGCLMLVALVVVTPTVGVQKEERPKQPIVVKSQNDFDTTYNRLKEALQKDGLMVVAEANQKQMLALVGVEYRNSVTILFARPEMGAKILPMVPECACDMPLRIAIVEKEDGVYVVYYQPSYSFGHYGNEKLTMMMRKMADPMFEKWVKTATSKE